MFKFSFLIDSEVLVILVSNFFWPVFNVLNVYICLFVYMLPVYAALLIVLLEVF